MNCCNEYGDCRQGRDCPVRQACELPITMEAEPTFDIIMRWLWTGMAWLGFFGMIAVIAFVWGYAL